MEGSRMLQAFHGPRWSDRGIWVTREAPQMRGTPGSPDQGVWSVGVRWAAGMGSTLLLTLSLNLDG